MCSCLYPYCPWEYAQTLLLSRACLEATGRGTTATSLLHVLLQIVAQAPYLATLEPQQGMPGSSATLAPICSLDTPSPMPTTSLQEPTVADFC